MGHFCEILGPIWDGPGNSNTYVKKICDLVQTNQSKIKLSVYFMQYSVCDLWP